MNRSAKLKEKKTGLTDLNSEKCNNPQFPTIRKAHAVNRYDTATSFK